MTGRIISGLALTAAMATAAHAVTINQSLCVRGQNRTMSTGASVTFWGFTNICATGSPPQIPGPQIEVGTGDTLNLTLLIAAQAGVNAGTGPGEAPSYPGHTIHMHGTDVVTSEDGVPETNGSIVNGDTYTWTPGADEFGSFAYHCHVHTVKHLEMGMYGSLVARPKDAGGNFLNQLTSSTATAYDYVQTYFLSTVDPAYHSAVGDSTVFADYNPQFFLINGAESKNTTAVPIPAAATLAAAPSKKVALRVNGIGMGVNGTFEIKDAAGVQKPFTVYIEDGRAWPTPRVVKSIDLSPAKRFDIIFTTPATTGTWYPQVTFKTLRTGQSYGTAYGKVTF